MRETRLNAIFSAVALLIQVMKTSPLLYGLFVVSPRRKDECDGDSTELEDSSEEDRRQAQRLPMATPQPEPTPPGSRGQNAPASMSGLAAVAQQRGMTQRELEEFLMPAAKRAQTWSFEAARSQEV